MRLIAITDLDRASIEEHVVAYQDLAGELGPEALVVQVRGPGRSALALLGAVSVLRDALSPLGVRVLVNDRADIAKVCGVAGVHLRESSIAARCARAILGPEALVTRACHDVRSGSERAREDPVDAILLSPIFETPGKAVPLGLAAIARLRAELPGPIGGPGELLPAVIALGGVTGENARACLEAGATGVSCIRAALDAGARRHLIRALRGFDSS